MWLACRQSLYSGLASTWVKQPAVGILPSWCCEGIKYEDIEKAGPTIGPAFFDFAIISPQGQLGRLAKI